MEGIINPMTIPGKEKTSEYSKAITVAKMTMLNRDNMPSVARFFSPLNLRANSPALWTFQAVKIVLSNAKLVPKIIPANHVGIEVKPQPRTEIDKITRDPCTIRLMRYT